LPLKMHKKHEIQMDDSERSKGTRKWILSKTFPNTENNVGFYVARFVFFVHKRNHFPIFVRNN
jgi:hypothetical protein